MAASVDRSHGAGQGELVDLNRQSGSRKVDLFREWVRGAMADSGHSQDSLSAGMGKSAGYVSKVLGGDKSIGAFLAELPADVEVEFVARWAEACGLIVVRPLAGDAALRAFVAGLMGMLTASSRLPERASQMARAEVRAPELSRRTA